jgi:uncharacterized protein (DUF1800 family)
VFQVAQHDVGVKTVLGQSGAFNGEDAIRILTSSQASARFVTAKFWSHFAYPVASTDPVVKDLVAGFAATLDVGSLVKAMFLHPLFRSTTARTGLVKQPIEYVVGVLRALRLPADDPKLMTQVVSQLRSLGQVPFDPPNVAGWPQNTYWLSTATAQARLNLARILATRADLSGIANTRASQRPAAVARLLGVDAWSHTTNRALTGVQDDPRSLVTLALVAPEYVLN